MKSFATIFVLLMAIKVVGQIELQDTIKIKPVVIQAKVNNQANQENLDSAVLENPQHLNLGDLLSKKSHLFIKSYGIGSQATISLRGSSSAHSQINWNGISLNSSMNGTTDLSLVPLFFMDQVDVNYGLSSLSEGSGGIGGAVNIVSQPIFSKKLEGSIAHTLGSFGQEQWKAKVLVRSKKLHSSTKVLFNKASNDFVYKDVTTEGFPKREVQNADFLQKGFLQSFHYKLKENQWLDANLWWMTSKRNLPPLLTLRNNTEYQEDKSLKSLIRYSNYFKNSDLKVILAFLEDQIYYENQRALIASSSKNKSIKARADYNFSWKSIKLHSQVKFDYNKAESDSYSAVRRQNRAEVYSSAFKKIGERMSVQLSARELIIMEEKAFLLPQAKLGYVSKNGQWYSHVKIGKNVKFPNLNDLYFEPSGNDALKAEESLSSEITLARLFHLNNANLSGRISGTGFYNSIDNYIQWEPTAFGFWRPLNLSSVETYGIEVFGELEQKQGPVKKHLTATYSYTSSRNWENNHEFDESEGKQLIYVPEHKGNVSLLLDYKRYQFSANYQVIGERFISSDNEEFLPTYSLFDMGLERDFNIRNHRLAISTGIKNVLNTEYQAIEWRPMPNRNYYLKLTYQFSK